MSGSVSGAFRGGLGVILVIERGSWGKFQEETKKKEAIFNGSRETLS